MKNITIIGYLGEDAKCEQKENYSLVTMNVATSEFRKDANNEKITITDWFSCFQSYNKEPKNLQYLKKGQRVAIQGSISFKQVKAENGNVYFNKNINVKMLEILFDKKETE